MKKKLDRWMDRMPVPILPPDVRKRVFNEYTLGYGHTAAKDESLRCLLCKTPTCLDSCPVQSKIPNWIETIQKENVFEGYKILRERNPFSSVCGRVCPQEWLCESTCILQRKENGESVAIGELERFIADSVRMSGIEWKEEKLPDTGKKVAIIGGGPAGLSAAYFLAKKGHRVTIFEALPYLGGVMRYGIPEPRLTREALDWDINLILNLGVEVKTNTVVGEDITLDQIRQEYDAVFIAVGSGRGKKMNIPGVDLKGSYSAVGFLMKVNTGEIHPLLAPDKDVEIPTGKKVVVVGGGFTAVDCALVSVRLDNEVHVVYRRTKDTSSARADEWECLEEEGVKMHWLTQPIEVLGNDDGEVVGLKCVKMKLVHVEGSKRPKVEPIPDSEHVIPCDVVIFAVGQGDNPVAYKDVEGLNIDKWNNLSTVDEEFRTNIEGIWAGGDVVNGGDLVVTAIKHGRVAAESIHKYLTTGKWEYKGKEE
ncbi:MAG: NADPH-dependent glutamate synthase [Desulfurobacteriaceae bacterium]